MDEEIISPMSDEDLIEAYENDKILNRRTYFDKDLTYIEEFDTYNGSHHIIMVKLENWTDEIKEFAEEYVED